jgi:hypothetical protein
MTSLHVASILAAGLFLVGVGACSSDDDGGGGGGCVCGYLPCGGSVTCDNGEDGTAAVSGDNCVLSSSNSGTATLRCDGTVTAGDSTGSTDGTWSFQGSSVVMNLGGGLVTCAMNPPASASCSSGGEEG